MFSTTSRTVRDFGSYQSLFEVKSIKLPVLLFTMKKSIEIWKVPSRKLFAFPVLAYGSE